VFVLVASGVSVEAADLGPSEQIALHIVDLQLAQALECRRVLDSLRHRLLPEASCKLNCCDDEMLAGLVVKQVANELDVDLQVCDRQRLQIGEGAVAGAEVVERERAAEGREAERELACEVEVLGQRGLGDLERDQARVGAFIGDQPFDQACEFTLAALPAAAMRAAWPITQRSSTLMSP
jgi:hypothetical protein